MNELLENEKKLLDSDKKKELTPGDLKKDSFLFKYFNPITQTEVTGIYSVASAIQQMLISHPKLNTNLENASKISKKIDISSSLEDNPGKKSSKKVAEFLLKVKKL